MSSRGETFVCGFKNSSLGETTQRQVCVDRGEGGTHQTEGQGLPASAGGKGEEPEQESEQEGGVGAQPGQGEGLLCLHSRPSLLRSPL